MLVIDIAHALHVFRERVPIEVVSPAIAPCHGTGAILVENRAGCLAFHPFCCLAAYREERQKFGVESFGEPGVPCIGLKRLPRDITDVFGVREEFKFLVFVPRVIGAEVEDVGGIFLAIEQTFAGDRPPRYGRKRLPRHITFAGDRPPRYGRRRAFDEKINTHADLDTEHTRIGDEGIRARISTQVEDIEPVEIFGEMFPHTVKRRAVKKTVIRDEGDDALFADSIGCPAK